MMLYKYVLGLCSPLNEMPYIHVQYAVSIVKETLAVKCSSC